MARTPINVMKLDDVNKPATAGTYASMLTTTNTTIGAEFKMSKDHKTIVLLVNDGTATATATIKAGNGIQGVSDLTVSLEAGEYTILCLDSGRFKNVSGIDKGKVVIIGTVKVAVFEAS